MSQLAEDFDLSYMKHIKSRVVPAFYQLPTLNSASTFGRSCCEMQNLFLRKPRDLFKINTLRY